MNGNLQLFVPRQRIPNDVVASYNEFVLPKVVDLPVYSDAIVVDTYTRAHHEAMDRFMGHRMDDPFYRFLKLRRHSDGRAREAISDDWDRVGICAPEDEYLQVELEEILRHWITQTSLILHQLVHEGQIKEYPSDELTFVLYARRDYARTIQTAAETIGMNHTTWVIG